MPCRSLHGVLFLHRRTYHSSYLQIMPDSLLQNVCCMDLLFPVLSKFLCIHGSVLRKGLIRKLFPFWSALQLLHTSVRNNPMQRTVFPPSQRQAIQYQTGSPLQILFSPWSGLYHQIEDWTFRRTSVPARSLKEWTLHVQYEGNRLVPVGIWYEPHGSIPPRYLYQSSAQ